MVTLDDCSDACEEHDCLEACAADYENCTEVSFYLIITSCISAKYGCEAACEKSTTTMSEYLDCRLECGSTFNDCLLQLDE